MNVYLFKVSVVFGKVNSNLGGGGGDEVQVMHIYIILETNQTTSDLSMFTKVNTPRWTSQIPKSSINTINFLHAV